MIKDIAIFGAGGLGKEIACLIDRINKAEEEPKWNFIGFFDDVKPKGTAISHFGSVLGGLSELNSWPNPLAIAIAIGKPSSIYCIQQRISNKHITFPNIIDPNFRIVDPITFSIGEGNIIQSGCLVSCDVTIGNFNVLNGSVTLGHDIFIGNFNVIMPGVRISGEVNVNNFNMLGTNSTILQQIKLGEHITIGAGSILMTKPKDNNIYLGVPAKIFKY